MKKRILVFLIIFLVFPALVFSIKEFTVQETEKISLQADATDPDRDKLTTTYTLPLNEKGEWQTNYGDAGEYKSTITVSDGIRSDSQDVLIVVKKKEESPKIEFFAPERDVIIIRETDSINFTVSASDANKDALSYFWVLDGKNVKEGQDFSYATEYGDAGYHKITAVVSDGTEEARKEWDVDVEKVDVKSLLDGIQDITVNENEAVKLKLPDFEKYGLSYEISEPVGSKNEWRTSYDDDGAYEVKVHAEGSGFSGDKIVRVIVNDVDRPPVFQPIKNRVINGDEGLEITLSANDPDGDEITYSANNLPEGARLEGNVFTWKPGYDAVRRQDFVDWFMDKFGVLSKSFYVQFAASSMDKKVVQNIVITVKDVNRAPVLEGMEPINISEGGILKIVPKTYDPDNDKVSLSYTGFIKTDTYKSKPGDAGTYDVIVTASDGLLTTSKFVQINIKRVNRVPVFGKMDDLKASEGENIAIMLDAIDPDGDSVSYSIDNPPANSSLKGNVFLWAPNYHILNKGETKNFDLVFAATDGRLEARKIVKLELKYRNRAPRIVNASRNVIARVNEPVLMSVKAVDDDGDELAYTWDFGFFEKYRATPLHQRIFTTSGTKIVKVIVSDGTDETEQLINVNVV